MELTLGIKLYRAFRFILITLFIAYLFYTKDVWRFYFTPFYFCWYFLPFIFDFISHLEHVGMSPEDYSTDGLTKEEEKRYREFLKKDEEKRKKQWEEDEREEERIMEEKRKEEEERLQYMYAEDDRIRWEKMMNGED